MFSGATSAGATGTAAKLTWGTGTAAGPTAAATAGQDPGSCWFLNTKSGRFISVMQMCQHKTTRFRCLLCLKQVTDPHC